MALDGNSSPDPSPQPKISVITATYNWSRALRCAIHSALLQTFSDFELLVIGDGCTDDSEDVVRSFDDHRVHWANLPSNSGNQAAPNNYGIERATGEYIAYLGHDDIWYPTHLESLIRTIEKTGADLAGSVAVLYGPPESGVRAITGIFSGGRFTARDFMPPSSILHKRSLTSRVGPWRSPDEIVLPPDVEFQKRAFEAGARIESSGELTVFKFNAAWRRNAYRYKCAAEQEAMLARIQGGADFRQGELLDVVRSAIEDRFIRITVPDSPAGTALDASNRAKGEYVREYIRFKGSRKLDGTAPCECLAVATRFYLEGQQRGFEWHMIECDERHGSFRWSGPSTVSTLEFPVWSVGAVSVRIHVLQHFAGNLAQDLRLLVDGMPVDISVDQTQHGTSIVNAIRHRDGPTEYDAPRHPIEITFRLPRTLRLSDLGVSDDRRWLGVAINWVEIAPLGAAGSET